MNAEPVSIAPPSPSDSALVANQRIIIIILLVVLFFSLLGSEAFTVINNVITYLVTNTGKLVMYIASNLGYSVGTIVDTTSNVASNATVSSIQLADGAIGSIGDIFRDANASRVSPEFKKEMDQISASSKDFLLLPAAKGAAPGGGLAAPRSSGGGADYAGLRRDLDDVINKVNNLGVASSATTARVDSTDDPIQKPITAQKASWCLVGEYNKRRGCVSVNRGDKCMSGSLFDTQELCMSGVSGEAPGTRAG